MSLNKNKHKVLKKLFERNKIGENNSGFGVTITDLGKSLSTLHLSDATKLSSDKINDVCYLLKQEELLTYHSFDENKKNHLFLITEKGKKAFLENYFLNKMWYRQVSFWFSFIAILISLSTLCWYIYRDINLNKNVEKLQNEIDSLKNTKTYPNLQTFERYIITSSWF